MEIYDQWLIQVHFNMSSKCGIIVEINFLTTVFIHQPVKAQFVIVQLGICL